MQRKRQEWSRPYPKWVKTHSITTRNVAIILAGIIALGLIFTYLRVSILGPYSGLFRNFPDVGSLYPLALEIATEEHPNAQLALITVVGKEVFDVYEMNDPELNYTTSFYFCAPSDESWSLQVDVSKDEDGLFGSGHRTRQRSVAENMQGYFLPDCGAHVIKEVPENFKSVVDLFRSTFSSLKTAQLEYAPRIMWLRSELEIGDHWAAVFKHKSEDFAYGIVIDSLGNVLKKEDDLRYPFGWQTGGFSDLP